MPEGSGGGADDEPRTVGAVLATIGRPERLAPLAQAVLEDPSVLELVAVVDGPDEGSVRVLDELARRTPRIRVLPVSRRGQLAALDAGVRAASADVVVLLDDDVLPQAGVLRAHLRHHQGGADLVVMGAMPVETPPGETPTRGTRLYAADYRKHVDWVLRGDTAVLEALWTGNLSMRRTDCLRVGLDNPGFPTHYHGDRDLGYRLADAGLRGHFDPTLGAAHRHRRSDEEFLRDAVRQSAGLVRLHQAHPERLPPFRLRQLVDTLARPLQLFVAVAGATAAGPAVARNLMRLAATWERVTDQLGRGDPLAPAKVARRIMQWRGATQALAGSSSGTAPAGTAKDAPGG